MASDIHVGSLLQSLIASKPGGYFLEIGTGLGLSLSWMIEGLDKEARIISIDNDPQLVGIAQEFLGHDDRVEIIRADGSEWITSYDGPPFDLIFADAFPGKYSDLEETLELLRTGGNYVVDDMLPQPNWPEGHEKYATNLIQYLENREDFFVTKMQWSTGILLATRV